MKTVLFCPGFQENIKSRDYFKLISKIEESGYNFQFVDINWKYTTPKDWQGQLMDIYQNYEPEAVILAGFSFGAITSILVAVARAPSELWLFSLSPYFSETIDDPNMKSSLKDIGKRRANEFRSLCLSDIASNIKCPVLSIYGNEEIRKDPRLKRNIEITRKSFKLNSEYIVDGARHDVTQKEYLQAIHSAIVKQ